MGEIRRPKPRRSQKPQVRVMASLRLLFPLLYISSTFSMPSPEAIFGPQLVHLESDHLLTIPSGWKLESEASPDDAVRLILALKQRNPEQLEETLYKISSPSSSFYGQHLSLAQAESLVSPTEDTIRTVWLWLRASGVTQCGDVATKDFWICDMSVSTAEKMMPGLKMMRFRSESGSSILRSLVPYQVPAAVAPHLDFVGGVHRFPSKSGAFQRKRKANTVQPRADWHLGTTPTVLRERYNLSSSDVGSFPGNRQMTAQFLEQYFHQADVSEFMRLFVGNEFVHRTQVDKIVGPNDESGRARVEASLDVDYIMSTGANISTLFWYTAGRHETQEPFLEWLLSMSNVTDLPSVCSVSYSDYETTLSKAYMERINQEFVKAGVRGISVLFASGDNGAGCREKSKGNYVYNPMYPSSSPFVTTVGGTVFDNAFEITGENTDFISGGGFSNVFDRPKYQDEAVTKFLTTAGNHLPDSHYYNAGGRGFPDLAALSDNYWIVANKIPTPYISGTSCSTPVWSGIISLINDVRLANNKTVLGFLNPMIYSKLSDPTAGLTDIVKGCHVGCLDSETLEGFCAQEGWDPTTGFGVPNYKQLIKTMLSF